MKRATTACCVKDKTVEVGFSWTSCSLVSSGPTLPDLKGV